MGVGKVGGGRKGGGSGSTRGVSGPGGASGTGGVSGPSGVGGVKGAGFKSRVSGAGAASKAGSVQGAKGVQAAQAADPLTARALEIAGQLKSGLLKSKEEATKKFVDEILKERLRMKSRALTSKIADTLQDDPRLSQALDRIWGQAK